MVTGVRRLVSVIYDEDNDYEEDECHAPYNATYDVRQRQDIWKSRETTLNKYFYIFFLHVY